MNTIRTAATLVILAVIITGISMANKPNEGDGINITVSPSTLMLSRDIPCVTIHSNIDGSAPKEELWLYRTINGVISSPQIQPYLTKTDSMGHLVAKFSDVEIRKIVDPGPVDLVLTRIIITDASEEVIFTSKPDTIMVKE
jgi:hypothetical protein